MPKITWLPKADARGEYIIILGCILSLVFMARAMVNDPEVGLSFLYIFPVVLAAWWFGKYGGLLTGLVGTGLFVADIFIHVNHHLLASAGLRAAIFCASGYFLGVLLERQRTNEEELVQLRALQEALIPGAIPQRPFLDIAARFEPATQGVAGDFYLITEGPNDSTVIILGDVCGKGIDAAQRASFVRASLAAFAPFTDDPSRLLQLANNSLIERAGPSSVFVTALCMVLRPQVGEVSWALAGHHPPYLLDTGTPILGPRPGLPLGIEFESTYPLHTVSSEAIPGMLLYTDGLNEARSDQGGLFGEKRIEQIIQDHDGESVEVICSTLQEAATTFSHGELADDLCLIAVRWDDTNNPLLVPTDA